MPCGANIPSQSKSRTDTAGGLGGHHAKAAMLQTPAGHGRLELFEYIHPEALESNPTRPNDFVMHRVAFSVDDIDKALEIPAKHGCHPLRGVATYKAVYKNLSGRFIRSTPAYFTSSSTQSMDLVTAFFQRRIWRSCSAWSSFGSHLLSSDQLDDSSPRSFQKPTARPAA